MKKILGYSTLTIILICLIFFLIGSNEKKDEIELSTRYIGEELRQFILSPIVADAKKAEQLYEVKLSNVSDYYIVQCGRSPGIGLAIIIKAKDDKIQEVKNDLEKYLKSEVKIKTYPDEKEIYEKAKVQVHGNLVSLLIFGDDVREDALAKFKSIIK